MVRIRLRRTGLKNQSTYRIMAADKESPRDGRFLEILGDYNPRTHPATIRVHEDRVFEWLQKGAQPSDSAVKVFNSIGLMDRYARFKAGEPIEKLLEEAKTASSKKASEPAPVKGISKKAAAKAKVEIKQETKIEESPKATEEVKVPEAKVEIEKPTDTDVKEEAPAAEEAINPVETNQESKPAE